MLDAIVAVGIVRYLIISSYSGYLRARVRLLQINHALDISIHPLVLLDRCNYFVPSFVISYFSQTLWTENSNT
jgi:hypothetical protein